MIVATLEFKTTDCEQAAFASMSFGKYEIFMGRSSWCAELQFGNHCIILSRALGVTKSQAIKICQDDFEQRVLACLAGGSAKHDVLKCGDKCTDQETFGDDELVFVGVAESLKFKNDSVVVKDGQATPVRLKNLRKIQPTEV